MKKSRGLLYGLVGVLVGIIIAVAGKPLTGDLLDWPLKAEVWGTVGQWVSSVFAGLSILVALSIVARDRNKDDWTEARKVVPNYTSGSDAPGHDADGKAIPRTWDLMTKLQNGSDGQLYNVKMVVEAEDDDFMKGLGPWESDVIPALQSHDTKVFVLQISFPNANINHLSLNDMIEIWIEFQTENGTTWRRDARRQTLIRTSSKRGILRFLD